MKTDCRFFNGYKPCHNQSQCQNCRDYLVHSENILIIHLGAMGAVLRSTSLLKSLRAKHPGARIFWMTENSTKALLLNNPYIDEVIGADFKGLLSVKGLVFHLAYVIDKDRRASFIADQLGVIERKGFFADPISGAIFPVNKEAEELWKLGLSNEKKFYENQKTEIQLTAEALSLIEKDRYHSTNFEYSYFLTQEEKIEAIRRKKIWTNNHSQIVIGINTGCSDTLPLKKPSLEYLEKLILKLQEVGYKNIVLLGGPEDKVRNQKLSSITRVHESPTEQGLRDGVVSIEACDLVFSGDSLGMHMGIALKKWIIAWFGPTCPQEIELFGRGVKVMSEMICSPCWKKNCNQLIKCNEVISLEKVVQAIEIFQDSWLSQKKKLFERSLIPPQRKKLEDKSDIGEIDLF